MASQVESFQPAGESTSSADFLSQYNGFCSSSVQLDSPRRLRMKRFAAVVTAAALMTTQADVAQMGAPGERSAMLSASPGPLAAKYKADADRIIAAAMADNDGYAALAYLTDHVGKRLSGTPQLNTAVQWGAELMKKAG